MTVGTHEQPFDRLIRAVDELKGAGRIDEDVFIQTGYATYKPEHCRWASFLDSEEMRRMFQESDVCITHGGPSSFLQALDAGTVPVVVPRRQELGEHVNDHQVEFAEMVERRFGDIVVVNDVAKLADGIGRSRRMTAEGSGHLPAENARFCERFAREMDGLLAGAGVSDE
ncbi:glycosyltransferase [Bifidobacterium saguinibicoloris]|uniref:glycosyltransferase n=1 Tax=Bifidobacterium saguinibicoloris TaxID=2834433 RepID=UPI001C56F6A2|nr:hypothetical protein [Bifidobacterium saguinibicoloris]